MLKLLGHFRQLKVVDVTLLFLGAFFRQFLIVGRLHWLLDKLLRILCVLDTTATILPCSVVAAVPLLFVLLVNNWSRTCLLSPYTLGLVQVIIVEVSSANFGSSTIPVVRLLWALSLLVVHSPGPLYLTLLHMDDGLLRATPFGKSFPVLLTACCCHFADICSRATTTLTIVVWGVVDFGFGEYVYSLLGWRLGLLVTGL